MPRLFRRADTVKNTLLLMERQAQARGRKLVLRKPPVLLMPRMIERRYTSRFLAIVRMTEEALRAEVIAKLPAIMDIVEAQRPKPSTDRYDVDTDKLVKQLFIATTLSLDKELKDDDLRNLGLAVGYETSEFNRKQNAKAFRNVLGIDLIGEEPFIAQELKNFSEQNVGLIKDVNRQFVANAQTQVFEGIRRGTRHEEIAKNILGTSKTVEGFATSAKKAKNRAKLIARDQVNKLNGQLNELRQTEAGLTKYTWRDSGDARVRDDHHLDGEVFSWNSSVSEGGALKPKGGLDPGGDVQCRCWAEPYFDNLI